MIMGNLVDPSQANLDFHLRAHVSGFGVHGEASFILSINNADGSLTKVEGAAHINDMSGVPLPLLCTGTACTSEVPAVFLGLASVSVQTCGAQSQESGAHAIAHDGNSKESDHCTTAAELSLPMQFESAYLNPFGGPILFASQGGEILVISTYSQAKIDWKGSQLSGVVGGTLDSTSVAGNFAMTVNAHEDLVAGTESEDGSIALLGMSVPSLNVHGQFEGHSTIPVGTPCDPLLTGLPLGTCSVTGLESSGSFSMHSGGNDIEGTYQIHWMAPAFAFIGSAAATVGHGQNDGGD